MVNWGTTLLTCGLGDLREDGTASLLTVAAESLPQTHCLACILARSRHPVGLHVRASQAYFFGLTRQLYNHAQVNAIRRYAVQHRALDTGRAVTCFSGLGVAIVSARSKSPSVPGCNKSEHGDGIELGCDYGVL